jgi:hypothetical protein
VGIVNNQFVLRKYRVNDLKGMELNFNYAFGKRVHILEKTCNNINDINQLVFKIDMEINMEY